MKEVRISAIAVAENGIPETSFARQLRRADGFTTLAVAVVEQALSTLPDFTDNKETAILIGTAFGPLATNFAALDTLLDDGEGQMSPTLFSHSVFNTAAGYLSRLFKIEGPTFTLANYCWPFLTALREGKNAINRKTVKRAIILEVETYSQVLTDAGRGLKGEDHPVLAPGAVAWILEDCREAGGEPVCILDSVEFEEEQAMPEDYLSPHPLGHAMDLSRLALELKNLKSKTWTAKAPFGEARVGLRSP